MAMTDFNPTEPVNHSHRSGERTREEAEMLASPLLARANLLRMRGQWDEAVAVCTEALRRAPESATAHSVLGDIYEAQGKLDDALQWYGMAVDLAPDRQTDREKLERVLQAQRARILIEENERTAALTAHRQKMAGKLAPLPNAVPGASGGRAAAERTVAWFDRIFPPGRSESLARLVFTACGILAALIVVAAVFVYAGNAGGHSPSFMTRDDMISSGIPSLSAPRPPVVVDVPTPLATSVAQGHPEATPSPAASGVPGNTPSSGSNSASTSDPLAGLRIQIARNLANSDINVTGLHTDANTPHVTQLEIALPFQGATAETAAATQERIARAAALAARTLAENDSAAERIVIRVALRQAAASDTSNNPGAHTANATLTGGSGNANGDTPVFAAETSPAIRNIDPVITPTETLLNQFSSVSWGPLPTANPTTAVSPTPTPLPTSSTGTGLH